MAAMDARTRFLARTTFPQRRFRFRCLATRRTIGKRRCKLDEWPLAHGPSLLSLWGLIFVALAFLLAPALSAPAIASEREAGLLESLQLSPLRPLQIAIGKWAASL